MSRSLSLALVLAASGPALLAAQTGGTAAPISVGIVGGLNSTTLGGKDAEDADRRTGFVAGLYLVKPLRRGLAFRPEILLSQKGAETRFDGDEGSVKVSLRVTYIEIPVLFQLESETASGLRPHGYAGPSIGVKSGCSLKGRGGGVSVSADCDEAELDVKTLDIGAVVGGGLGFPLGTRRASVGARYHHGLVDLASDTKVQNRVLSLYASVEFGKI